MKTKSRIISLLNKRSDVNTVSGLENQLGFTNGTIGHWDKRTPGSANLIKVADFFGCSLDYLTERSDNPGINRNINESNADNYDIDDLLDQYLDRYNLEEKHKEAIQSVVLTYLNANKRM